MTEEVELAPKHDPCHDEEPFVLGSGSSISKSFADGTAADVAAPADTTPAGCCGGATSLSHVR